MTPQVIIGLGEILWDMLPDGKQLGGAPANFAYHTKALAQEKVDSHIISAIGSDLLGAEIQARLDKLLINHKHLHINKHIKTGTVSVTLDNQGNPDYFIEENVAWDFIPEIQHTTYPAIDAVCFGTLALRNPISKKSIIDFLTLLPVSTLKIFDLNLRQSFFNREIIEASLNSANILKINTDELSIVSNLLQISGNEEELLKTISQHYRIKLSILTKGNFGSFLYSEGQSSNHPGFNIKCKDSVGAGDAFTAAITLGLLNGFDLDTMNNYANQVASFVCTKSGATPKLPSSLVSLFH